MPSEDDQLPDYDDLPLRAGLRAAWDVWPPADAVYGCLNLITHRHAVDAARLVERGATFALNWSMGLPDPPLFGRESFVHRVSSRPSGTSQDDVLDNWNTQSSSQWDGFRHIRHPAAADDEPGTGHFGGVDDGDHGIDRWARRGIVTRGVLADIGRWRDAEGRPLRHDAPDPVIGDELLACLADQGVEVRTGDVLLVRFGWIAWYLEQDPPARRRVADPATFASCGFDPDESTARTLWNLHVAALACDNPGVEIWPRGSSLDDATAAAVRDDPRRIHEAFVHARLLPMLGLPLGEMFFLDDLAADCAADGRYDFMFTSAPLHLPGGVASPPNALALK